jgi:uncharacterized protein involved in copper resistance
MGSRPSPILEPLPCVSPMLTHSYALCVGCADAAYSYRRRWQHLRCIARWGIAPVVGAVRARGRGDTVVQARRSGRHGHASR